MGPKIMKGDKESKLVFNPAKMRKNFPKKYKYIYFFGTKIIAKPILDIKTRIYQLQQQIQHSKEMDSVNMIFEGYIERGKNRQSKGDYYGAIEDYSQAIRLKADYAAAYNNRGSSKYSLKDYKGAIEDYSQAIRLKPDYTVAYCNRGVSKHSLKDYKGAIEDYSQAIRLKPDYAIAYNNRGVSKDSLQDFKGAIEDYNQAIRLKGNCADCYNSRGISQHSLQDYKGAIEDYSQAIRLKADYSTAYNNRGNSKKILQDYKGAQSDFLAALRLCPQPDPLYIFNLANLYLDMDQKKEALKRYTEGVKAFKKETEANLKIKFNLTDGNINHIKSSINNFEKLTNQVQEIKRQAQRLNRTEVLQQLSNVNEAIASACIKSACEKANQTQTHKKQKALEEQLKELRKKLKYHSRRLVTVQKEVDKLKAKVEQMGKYIYAEKKVLGRIDQIDSRKLSEFYRLLYSTLINHFMAYRILSTGFFSESPREVTTFEKFVGNVCKAQSIIESIPILGDLVAIPFKILGIVREEKSNRLNSIIADKINGSKLQSEARITSYMSHLVEVLIDNKPFNSRLVKAIQDEEKSFLNKAMDKFSTLKEKIYTNVFGGSSGEYSYVQQVVTLYMAKFTLQLYEVKSDKFQQHCESEESFSDFFMKIFTGPSKKQPESMNDDQSQPLLKAELNPSIEKSAKNNLQPTYWQRISKWFCS